MRLGIAALLCLVTLPAYGQAFGTSAGMKVEAFSAATQFPYLAERFRVKVPVPNPDVAFYDATIGPNIGLCEIEGQGYWMSQPDERHMALTEALNHLYGLAAEMSHDYQRWMAPGMNVTLAKSSVGDGFYLTYTFRDPADCKADAIAATTSTTGL